MFLTRSKPRQNKAIMRRMTEELWNKKNLAVADELFALDATTPGLPLPHGPEGAKLVATMFLSAFPDLHMTIDDIIAEGDEVVGRFTETATHQGEFMGIPATGRKVQFGEIGILRIKRRKIITSWYQMDLSGLIHQISAPTPVQHGLLSEMQHKGPTALEQLERGVTQMIDRP